MIGEREAYLWFGSLKTIGPAGRREILDIFGNVTEFFSAPEQELMALVTEGGLKQETLEEILLTRKEDGIRKTAEAYDKRGFRFLSPADPDYPELLREIPDPPATLFYRGHIEYLKDFRCLGVVGTRTPSLYGKDVARMFVPKLAQGGLMIVSGMAAGIDTEAHKLAVAAGGKTAAILGGGIDICYPQRNFSLYQEMCETQLVLSEYPPGLPPIGARFPLRNRIISGLSEGVLVLEARKRSGTLITADAALDQGRNVYSVPGRLGDPLSEGTNNLIRQGAMCVLEPEEILEDLGMKVTGRRGGRGSGNLTGPEKEVLSRLSLDPVYLDDILTDEAGTLQELLVILGALEKKGLIHQPIQGYYARN